MAFSGWFRPKGVPFSIFLDLRVYERVGILLVEVYERGGKSVIWFCERSKRANRFIKYMKGVPFVDRRYTRGVPFSWKNGSSKGKGLDLWAEPPRIKICWVGPPPPLGGLLLVFWNFPRVWFIACLIAVFGMLLGDTLILDDLDCANKYRQQVSTLVVNAFKGDVTRGDSQQRF